MKLIELLRSDLNTYKENGAAKCVFLRKDFSLPDSKTLSQEELLEYVKNAEVKLENEPNVGDHPDWLLICSTSYLKNSMTECGIENIDAEFQSFCDYMEW